MRIVIGNITYHSIKELEDRYYEVTHVYRNEMDAGAEEVEISPDDVTFISQIVEARHPEALWKERASSGSFSRIKYVRIPGWTGIHLNVKFVNGSVDRLGIKHCFRGEKATHDDVKITRILRKAVEDHTNAFKNIAFGFPPKEVPCPITKQMLNISNCEVDHVEPTFIQLKNMFFLSISLDESEFLSSLKKSLKKDDEMPASLKKMWREIHYQHTRGPNAFRVISKPGHIKASADARRKKKS